MFHSQCLLTNWQSTFKPTGLSESSWLRFTFTAHGQTLTQQPGRSVSSRSQYVAVLMCLTSPHLLLSPLICRIMQACIILYLAQAKLFRKYHEMASKETGNSCKFADCTSAPDLLIDADQPATRITWTNDVLPSYALVDWLGIERNETNHRWVNPPWN